YAESLWRPAFHAMPGGSWTNETHGMTYSDGQWHVFFKIIDREEALRAQKMLEYAQSRLISESYIPYYLYRQTRMVGNLENVGWSKRGYESLYNVYVMDETHTILACGSGGVTKLKNSSTDYLKRVFNFKFPYEYIDRFDEILKRKEEIYAFYTQNLS
ncbi:MAG: hypothetical protein II190_02180, partial [Ruminococcus sp.]|nr:hypothetical protein [Ruminococcus sp.]